MSSNKRGGVPGFADPALDALEDNFRSDEGREWADAAEEFAQLSLQEAKRLLKKAAKKQAKKKKATGRKGRSSQPDYPTLPDPDYPG